MSNNGELKRRASELHRDMTAMGDATFFPTGGVFLTNSRDYIGNLISKGSDRSYEEAWRIYAEWHEAVHIVQIVTSPYVCLHAFRLGSLAHEAFRLGEHGDRAELCEMYKSANSEFSKTTASGFSPWEIIETHAVTQGLLWEMPLNKNDLKWVANHFYGDSSKYVRVLNLMSEKVGDEAAIRLLPRLCFLALQAREPTEWFAHLISRIASESSVTRVCDYTHRQLCEWANIDVSLVTKSLRERDTPLRDHPFMGLFSLYFDAYECITSIDDRLSLLMGDHGAHTFRKFRPMFTVYAEGEVKLAMKTATEHEEEELVEQWINITCELVDGLRALEGTTKLPRATRSNDVEY